jgi:PAT family beta-lactamase induction signal transducer AmpG
MKKNTIALYADRRILSIFLLGIASGLPWVMIGSALTLWLKQFEISRTDIGYAALIYSVYAINFFWSPLIDRLNIPLLSRLFGARLSWVIPCQLVIALTCFLISTQTPENNAKLIVFMALIIAAFSATQDIAIDAYRIDSFSQDEPDKISSAAGVATAGWWTGYAAIGFIPLWLSDKPNWEWHSLYALLGSITLLIIFASAILPKPKYSKQGMNRFTLAKYTRLSRLTPLHKKIPVITLLSLPILLGFWAFAGSAGIPKIISEHAIYVPSLILFAISVLCVASWQLTKLIRNTPQTLSLSAPNNMDVGFAFTLASIAEPIADFFRRNGARIAVSILLFIFLFKIGEAFLGRMSILFYKEVGFSNTEIATYSKMLTWWITIISALAAGVLNAKLGLIKGLFVSGAAMALSNLMFIWIALSGPQINIYIATIIVDGFASAWSTVAFVAFISALCNHRFSASQYALLASLGSLGRTMISSTSGQLVDWLGGNWSIFFSITIIMIIPSMVILWKIKDLISPIRSEQ